MKNIHIIPTDKPSRLRYNLSNVLALTKESYRDYSKQVNQHIYITNSEEIKVGDWCLSLNSKKQYVIEKYSFHSDCIVTLRIILTTDQDLIKDGVQAINDEFLEWFVKNPSCESVEIYRSGNHYDGAMEFYEPSFYSTIIPKEEPRILTVEAFNKAKISYKELPQFGTKEFYTFFSDLCDKNLGGKPKQEIKLEDVFNEEKKQGLKEFIENHKQETLEEASKNPINYTKETNGYPKIQAFIDGAKWQQERSYSEEEVLSILNELGWGVYVCYSGNIPISEWMLNAFEQFKKK